MKVKQRSPRFRPGYDLVTLAIRIEIDRNHRWQGGCFVRKLDGYIPIGFDLFVIAKLAMAAGCTTHFGKLVAASILSGVGRSTAGAANDGNDTRHGSSKYVMQIGTGLYLSMFFRAWEVRPFFMNEYAAPSAVSLALGYRLLKNHETAEPWHERAARAAFEKAIRAPRLL